MEILDQQSNSANERSVESVLENGYVFKLGDYLRGGFKLFGGDVGAYIGFCLVSFIISIVAGSIPYVGDFAGLLLSPAFAAGWFIYARRQQKGMSKEFGNFFDGFKSSWPQLIIQNFFISVFVVIAMTAVVLPFVYTELVNAAGTIEELQKMAESNDQEGVLALLTSMLSSHVVLGMLLGSIIAAMVASLYILAPMFTVFRGMQFWDAMEASRKVVSKNYLHFVLFTIVLWLLIVFGFISCCIGLLAAVPVMYLSIYTAFEDIMGSDDPMV
jgi:uncharacterized membrane protein